MPPVWLQLLALAIQAAPTVVSQIQNDINQHWGKDHVQQVLQGAGDLQQIASTVVQVAQANSGTSTQGAGQPKS